MIDEGGFSGGKINASTIEVSTFGLELLGKLVAASPGQNVAISPLCLAHTLVLAAVRSGDSDAAAIYKTLRCQWFMSEQIEGWFSQVHSTLEESSQTKMAAACWADFEFPSPPNIEGRQSNLGASEQSIDFGNPDEAADTVNRWIKEATGGHIFDLVTSKHFRKKEKQVLTSALYFYGSWLSGFQSEDTKMRIFHRGMFQKSVVETMRAVSESLSYYENNDFRAVQFPFQSNDGDSRYGMQIFLPTKKSTLSEFCSEITKFIADGIPFACMESTEIELELPKFTMNERIHCMEFLQSMGMESNRNIDEIIQRIVVEIDEDGMLATAASVIIAPMTAPLNFKPPKLKRIKFHARRPFLWTIIEESNGAMLFAGVVANP